MTASLANEPYNRMPCCSTSAPQVLQPLVMRPTPRKRTGMHVAPNVQADLASVEAPRTPNDETQLVKRLQEYRQAPAQPAPLGEYPVHQARSIPGTSVSIQPIGPNRGSLRSERHNEAPVDELELAHDALNVSIVHD